MINTICRIFGYMGLLAACVASVVTQAADDGEKILNARCSVCHQRLPEGGMDRVSAARKTPEAWDMTLVRMMLIHGVEITSSERRALVKYLSDTQGLAPSEAQPWRYILERRPNVIESPPDDDLAVMCARCHSYARVALQYRDEDDWRKLSHFHQGQYPTSEYQAFARDRNWWEIASGPVPKQLAELYPLQTEAWEQWHSAEKTNPAGAWLAVGQQPGKGRYVGTATITASDDDRFDIQLDFIYADGDQARGTGSAVLYTGYEWRARVQQGERTVLQIMALSEDGNTLSGRWFFEDADALGGDLRLVRLDSGAQILAVEPPYLQQGETQNVIIHGAGLQGDLGFGSGVEVTKVLYQDKAAIAVQITAADDAAIGPREVRVGDLGASGLLTVYGTIDRVQIEPDYAIARVGGNDGPLEPVPAQFDAVAYLNGADGTAGTDDDIRIGVMPAQWSVSNANEMAVEMRDTDYAGAMQANGLFMPAAAGPNPERRYGTNNVGELTVTAAIQNGDQAVEGQARLIVTVQRWNDPPIR